MKNVIAFANASAKRNLVFKDKLQGSLQGLCDTRFIEKHDGHLQFQGDALIKICDALQTIAEWTDSKTAAEALCLYQTLRSSEFLVAAVCLCDVLGTTVSLSRILQSPSIDLLSARNAIEDVLSVLEEKRQKADSVFQQLFSKISDLALALETIVTRPRTVPRQTQRANVQSADVEEYYRKTVYLPLLDWVISDLKDRLSPDVMKLFNLKVFLPQTSYSEEDLNKVREVAEFYGGLLGVPVQTVISEFKLWVAKWQRESKKNTEKIIPSALSDVIDACDTDLYPSINILLSILATLPVSVATSERSFSTLRRLKSWLRASMTEQRLVGLALLNVHRDIEVDADNIITKYAKSLKRKLDFVL